MSEVVVTSCGVMVSTHSRPKAAAFDNSMSKVSFIQFQHTAARRRLHRAVIDACNHLVVSTHSRPKAAAIFADVSLLAINVSTHSRPKAAAPYIKKQEKSAD